MIIIENFVPREATLEEIAAMEAASAQLAAEERHRPLTEPEILSMLDRGEFIVYPRSFLAFLFEMRGTFGFPTK